MKEMRTNKSRHMRLVKNEVNTIGGLIVSLRNSHNGLWIEKFRKNIASLNLNSLVKINTLSLFTGAGGLDIGFHDAGFNIVQAVEIENKFCDTLKANAGKTEYFGSEVHPICADIRSFYPSNELKIDFIIGGPPCQTFSAAGRRAEGVLGTTESRGTLFEEYVRLLKILRPAGFLFENVYGITGAEKGKSWKKIVTSFKEAGYSTHFRILSASDYGVPQNRERMFIVGTKDRPYKFPRPTHGPDSPSCLPHTTARDVLEGLKRQEGTGLGGKYGYLLKEIPPGLNYSFFTEKMGHPRPIFAWRSKFSDFLYKANPDAPIRTIKASGGQYTGPFHWDNRPFTIEELKRLQTFPDCYKIIGKRQIVIKQIGNSVPPQIARILALSILNQVFGVKLPFSIPILEHDEELNFRRRKKELHELYGLRAKEAIKKLDGGKMQLISSRLNYFATLDEEFYFRQTSEIDSNVYLKLDLNGEEWIVNAYPNKDSCNQEFVIKITPKHDWKLPCKRVYLKGHGLSKQVFTSLWKAFEQEIARNGIKADLVQLNGYYQYAPDIKISMDLDKKSDPFWRCLSKIVSGAGIRATHTSRELASQLQITESKIMDLVLFLRDLGYEARNHNTNPQVPRNSYIIPYSFPTLTPASVQLRKSLTNEVAVIVDAK